MELAELQRQTQSSIDLTLNSKGTYQWDVKIYFENGDGLAAVETAKAIDTKLREQFTAAG